MRAVLLAILILSSAVAFGQKDSECDLFTASMSYCRHDYKEALAILLKFRDNFPEHPLIEEVYQKIGHLYLLIGDSLTSKRELHHVIKGHLACTNNDDFIPFSCKNWDTAYSCHMAIVYPEPYVHLQHLACLDLVDIYKGENQIDSALKYLGLADTAYFYNYGCVNGNDMKAIELALLYKDLYIKQNNIKAAAKELTRVIFTYEQGYKEVSQSLKELLPKIYTQEELHNEIEQAINNLERKSDEVNGKQFSWFQLNLFGVLLRIPMFKAYTVKEGKMRRCETAEQMKQGIRDTPIIRELLQ